MWTPPALILRSIRGRLGLKLCVLACALSVK